MTRHGKQYGAIVMMFVGLVALPGSGQAKQQEITGKDGAPGAGACGGIYDGGNEAVLE
jgi:hypothetical protein